MYSVQNNRRLSPKEYVFHLIIYLSIASILFVYYQYAVQQDLISYLSISKKYFVGDFSNAVNGVWGPLISWLMVPFFYLKLNPIISFKFMQIIIGAFTLIGAIQLLNLFNFEKLLTNYLIISFIIIIEFYIFLTGTPDLLFTCLTIYLIIQLIKPDYSKITFGIFAGILGTFLYFAKPFGFPFFIVLYSCCHIYYYLVASQKSKLIVLRNALTGLIVFSILVSPWIFIISSKYEKITFSTGGEYNFAIIGPDYNGTHLPRIEKLYQPVNESATSYWEDPSFLIAKTWSPFTSIENFIHLLKIIVQNIVQILYLLIKFSPLILPLLLINFRYKLFERTDIKIIMLITAIYISGISLLFVHQRFLIAVQIISTILTGLYISRSVKKFKFFSRFEPILYSIIFISLIVQPSYSLSKYLNYGKDVYQVTEQSIIKDNISGNIASISKTPLQEDWANSLAMCYLLDSKYFGEMGSKTDESSMITELSKYNISYLFVWDVELNLNHENFSRVYSNTINVFCPLIGKNRTKKITVYKLD